ncbi:MAG: ankyrin repeat domain-containing protein [Rickettsiaceae bacterium]|nr:ankyrin repeat domain-containing protein [Rickettsiaceae bacterium]
MMQAFSFQYSILPLKRQLNLLYRHCYEFEVAKFLIEHGADVNAADYRGYSLLSYLARYDSKYHEFGQFLIDNGADINGRDVLGLESRSGSYPLHNACKSRSADFARMLLSNGANPNLKDAFNRTPFDYSCKENKPEIVKLLLENGAIIDISLLKNFIVDSEVKALKNLIKTHLEMGLDRTYNLELHFETFDPELK